VLAECWRNSSECLWRLRGSKPVDNVAEGIWLTGELLEPDERAWILARSHENGYHEAIEKAHGRNNSESPLCLPDVANRIASRLNSEIRKAGRAGFCVSEISSSLLCCRYQPGDNVVRHFDGPREVNDGTWSAFTLVLYLNDGFTGGATGFPKLGIELVAPPGHGILFKHRLLHEGKTVVTGEKFVIVTFAATRTLSTAQLGGIGNEPCGDVLAM
jgi:2OG-Fe(II) oxygenase superfamily